MVCNTYLMPIIANYLTSLVQTLKRDGYQGDVLIVQSNGGAVPSELATRLPVNTVLSGPAAGVVAARHVAKLAGFSNIISCDMGGTSFDVSLIDHGELSYSSEKMVDFGIPIEVPVIEITTIGAGGGSIAWVDRGGMLRVGPQSAGADPGPAAYGKESNAPTVTDANLILGRIPDSISLGAEGTFKLNIPAAEKCIREKIAQPLEKS